MPNMDEEREHLFEDNELRTTVRKYEQMMQENRYVFFDSQEFENIIDYYIDTSSLTEALKAADVALGRFPDSGSLMMRKAQVLLSEGKAPEALRYLDRVTLPDSETPDYYLLKGTILAEMGRTKNAIHFFHQAIDRTDEDKGQVYYQIAYSFERHNDYKTALRYLHEAYSFEPKDPNIVYDLAWSYDRLEQNDKAIGFYKQYLDIDPFAENVWYNLGIVYMRTEEYEKAIDAFDFSIAIDSTYASAHYSKGTAYANLFDFRKAIEVFTEYLELEKDSSDGLAAIGECYERLNEYDKAQEYYQRVLKKNPHYADAWYGMGIISYFREDYLKSLGYITRAIEFQKEEGEYWFSLGNVLVKLNNTPEAVESFRKATELDPYDYESWLNLSEVYYHKKDLKQAVSVLNEARVYNEDVGAIHYRLAAYYFSDNQPDKGYASTEKGLALDYDSYSELYKFYPGAKGDNEIEELIIKYQHINQKS